MKSVKIFSLLIPVFMLSGCAGYRVGSTLDPSIRTVSVQVENKTDEPSIEVEVMKALRAEIQMDGRLQLVSRGDADAELTVTLTRFHLNPLAYDRRRGTLAREYRLTLNGRAVLRNSVTGEVILDLPSFQGDSEFPYEADLTTAKREALPEASRDLARKVISSTINPW